MYGYYFALAWRSFRQQPWFLLLIALILGAGVGLFTTTYSLLAVLAGDPVPEKSERLLSLRIGGMMDDGEPVAMMSSPLVDALRKALPDLSVTATTYGFGAIESDTGVKRQSGLIRFSDAGFFDMFDVPMLAGRGWTVDEDANAVPVAVIGRAFAQSMFGNDKAVGRSIAVGDARFRIIGVMDYWQPMPRYYDLSVGVYVPADDVFVPLSAVRAMDDAFFMARMCPLSEADVEPRMLPGSSCMWLNVWALVGSSDRRALVQSRVDSLLQQWRVQEGWPKTQSTARVENVRELLRRTNAIPGGARFGVLLAFGFLLLCSVNAAGLLLAKCLRRSQEIGVRRALGASRRDIVRQFLVEAGLLSLASGMFGVIFAAFGIKLTQQLPTYYMQFVEFSLSVLILVLVMSLLVSIAASLFPAWRASLIEPAIQIKVD